MRQPLKAIVQTPPFGFCYSLTLMSPFESELIWPERHELILRRTFLDPPCNVDQ